MLSVFVIAHTIYVMAGGDSSQPYLPLYETNLSSCKILVYSLLQHVTCSIFQHSYPVSRNLHDFLLCDVHHFLSNACSGREKGVPRPLLSMDDHHAPSLFIHGWLWSVVTHRLLHSEYGHWSNLTRATPMNIQSPAKFLTFFKWFFSFAALELFCSDLHLAVDELQCKTFIISAGN